MLARPKLNTMEALISKALIALGISHGKCISNVLKEHNEMKWEIKHLKP